jgi:hypothetical protein
MSSRPASSTNTRSATAASTCSQLSSSSSVWRGKGPSRGRGEIEGERNRRGHEGCIRQGRQVGPDDAIGEVLGALVGDGQGQPGLVGAAGPDQGEHRGRLVEQRGPRGRSLRIPADEPSPRRGQGRRIGRDRIGFSQSTISDCPAEGAR